MFVRRQTSETFFIGRPQRVRREAALAEVTRLLESTEGERLLRTALAAELPSGRADELAPEEVAEAVADGVAAGRLLLIGVRPRPVWAPTFAESGPPEGDEAPPPPEEPADEAEDWLEIELTDQGDPPQPIPGARYVVELSDGTIVEGTLDEKGKAMVEGIKKGSTAKVSFPDLDAKEWK